MGYPSVGSGRGSGAGVASTLFQKKDGTDAIFTNTGARDAYFRTNPDELKKIGNHPVGIGTADAITAAYVYDKTESKWHAAASNFRGPSGKQGKPGAGLDPNLLHEGELPKWDRATNKLIPSGLSSPSDGELRIAPSSILFGNHAMSSSVENVVFRNQHTHRIFAPVWQEVAPGIDTAHMREYSSTISKVVRVPDGNIDVINPTNSGVKIDVDEIFLGGQFTLAQPATSLMLEIYDTINGNLVWRQRLGNHQAGKLSVTFEVPFDVRQGYTYDVKLLSEDGSDVVVKSNAATGFSWTINRATWKDLAIASQDWVKGLDIISNLAITNGKLTFDKSDGTKDELTLPAVSGEGSVLVKDFTTSAYQSVGSEVSGKSTFFIYKGSSNSNFKLPDMKDIPVGGETSITVKNPTQYDVTVNIFDDEKIYPRLTSIRLPPNHTMMFLSDKMTNLWHPITLEGTPISSLSRIVANSDGKGFTAYSSDGTSTSITLDAYADKAQLDALKLAVDALKAQKLNRLKSFIYTGSVPPTYPSGNRGAYYLTLHTLAGNLNVLAPAKQKPLADGAVFFVDNNDNNYSVNLLPGKPSQTLDGKASTDVPPNTVSWFIKDGDDWKLLFSGYVPATYKTLAAEIKATLLADDTFIRDVQIQGDDPNIAYDCTSLEFPKAKVTPDPKDPQRGVIEFPDLTFINPDGKEFPAEKVKLVGMEIVDPGNGDPLKLTLLNPPVNPKPSGTSAYAFFSDSPTAPPGATFTTLPVYRGGKVNLHKDTSDGQYAYILLPPGEGTDVNRVAELGGLPSFWAKSSKNYPVNGQPRVYTVLRSPYKFHEQDITFVLYK